MCVQRWAAHDLLQLETNVAAPLEMSDAVLSDMNGECGIELVMLQPNRLAVLLESILDCMLDRMLDRMLDCMPDCMPDCMHYYWTCRMYCILDFEM